MNKRQVWKSKVLSMATESTDEITSVPVGLKGRPVWVPLGFLMQCMSYLLLIPSWISFYHCCKKLSQTEQLKTTPVYHLTAL